MQKKIDEFYEKNMQRKNWLAVHLRGADNQEKNESLVDANTDIYPYVDLVMRKNPNLGIFLVTDSKITIQEFKARYDDILLTKDYYINDNVSQMQSGLSGGLSNADYFLIEPFLAARCSFFLGRNESNESLAIYDLKKWSNGCAFLMGSKSVRTRNYLLHAR